MLKDLKIKLMKLFSKTFLKCMWSLLSPHMVWCHEDKITCCITYIYLILFDFCNSLVVWVDGRLRDCKVPKWFFKLFTISKWCKALHKVFITHSVKNMLNQKFFSHVHMNCIQSLFLTINTPHLQNVCSTDSRNLSAQQNLLVKL